MAVPYALSLELILQIRVGMELILYIIDFAKAFNTVVHTKLIAKLRCYGVRGTIFRWIESWLCNRYQCVQCVRVVHQHYVGLLVESRRAVCLDLYSLYFLSKILSDDVSVKLFADDAKIYT